MANRDKIQFDLIKLVNGDRILRLSDPQSGLSLEKKLSSTDEVARLKKKQKKLLQAFEAALDRAELAAA
jgi:hypothetical protein